MLTAILAACALGCAAAAALGTAQARRPARRRRGGLDAVAEALGAALAVGLPLQGAFAEIASAMPSPYDVACRRVAAALRLGIDPDEALAELRSCAPAQDVAALSVVLTSFARTGGPVRRSLGRVAALIRGRSGLADERAALTAQARLSAAVLAILVPAAASLLWLLMPSSISALLARGPLLVLLAIALETIGAAWLWWLIRAREDAADLATLVDVVVVGLDAGLTFERSLASLVARAPAVARGREARRLLADLSLGRGTLASFRSFAQIGPAEARVAGIVVAATRLGAPLAELLVAQADALRATARREAQARARRLPVLMLFPLSLCVLPALLVVFLGGPLLTLVR